MATEPMTMSKEQERDARLKAEYAGYPGHKECAVLVPEIDALRAEVERLKATHASEMRRARQAMMGMKMPLTAREFAQQVAQLISETKAQVRAETLEQAAWTLEQEAMGYNSRGNFNMRKNRMAECKQDKTLAKHLHYATALVRALSTRRDSPEGGA